MERAYAQNRTQRASEVLIKRQLLQQLTHWASKNDRKPLLIRGARQVGKSTLVQQFAKKNFENIIELNFELQPTLKNLFKRSLHPDDILRELSLVHNTTVTPGANLLFLDEIQACPEALVLNQALNSSEAPANRPMTRRSKKINLVRFSLLLQRRGDFK